mgnify:CR=1 FL=1
MSVGKPMLEVLGLLRAGGFTCFIVSGGGVEFIRAFSEGVYGIPPHALLQHTPSTQKPLVHWLLAVQETPLARLGAQALVPGSWMSSRIQPA